MFFRHAFLIKGKPYVHKFININYRMPLGDISEGTLEQGFGCKDIFIALFNGKSQGFPEAEPGILKQLLGDICP